MIPTEEFDWNDLEPDCVVQQSVEQVAIYSNPKDDIVIRQQGSWPDSEDVWIIIARAHAFRAARQILEAAGFTAREADMMARRPEINWEAHLADFARASFEAEQPEDHTARPAERSARQAA